MESKDNSGKNKKIKELEEEKLNPIPGLKPFTKFKWIEMGICLFAVIIGVLYLTTGIIPLYVLLPLYFVCFAAIPVLRYIDIKKSGEKGFASYLPFFMWVLMAALVLVATILYFTKYVQ